MCGLVSSPTATQDDPCEQNNPVVHHFPLDASTAELSIPVGNIASPTHSSSEVATEFLDDTGKVFLCRALVLGAGRLCKDPANVHV